MTSENSAELRSQAHDAAEHLATAFLRLCESGGVTEIDANDFHNPVFMLSDTRPIEAQVAGVIFTSTDDPQSTRLAAYYEGQGIANFFLPEATIARRLLEQMATQGTVTPDIHYQLSHQMHPEDFEPDRLEADIREAAAQLLQLKNRMGYRFPYTG